MIPLRLAVVSAMAIEETGLQIENRIRPWTAPGEREDLGSFDVGLLPLFDDPVDRGKSPLKLLQYAAAGLPIIASPVAIDRSVWVHGETILFATTPEEWTRHAADLAKDPARRVALGSAGRRLVEKEFTHAAWADRLAGILRDAAGAGKGE